ncbi:hypothetical protein B0T18DRAFT_450667 [Schizothecium vesticola]|uniref:Myb-like domain-containing protein n=1 Tax=Schizothecium vesticola TaxID=314040 RepID=A0AA40BR43_9PEZI|nr:hypothetical protein B0T18DRAFT_450667 [Schizothecium vesticola]
MDPFPNYNDPHANDLYNPSSAYGLPGSNDYQFDFDISQTADALPSSNNINGLNQTLEAEQAFRQNFQTGQNFHQTSQAFQTSQSFHQTGPNFQTNMPLYANPLALVNSGSGEPGQGDTTLNHRLVDQNLFQMGHGLGQPIDGLPMVMQPEQAALPEDPFFPNGLPPGYNRLHYSNNAEHGQSLNWSLSRGPFLKTAAEGPFQSQAGFSQTFSEYGASMSRWQPDIIHQQQQGFQNPYGIFPNSYYNPLENPPTFNKLFVPQHCSHDINMSGPQQISLGCQSTTPSGISSNTSNVGSFSSASLLEPFDRDNMLDDDFSAHGGMWSESSPHSNLDSAEDAPTRTAPFHHPAPMSGLGPAGWNATTPGSHLQVPTTISPKQLALRTSPSFESAASSSESLLAVLDNDANDGQWFNPPTHVAPARDEPILAPKAGDKDPKPAEKPAKHLRGRKALPDGPKPARHRPIFDASPFESPSPARRRAKRRHLPATEEDDLFTPLSDDSDLPSDRGTTKPPHKSKAATPKPKPKARAPVAGPGSPRKSLRLRPEAAAATPAATIKPVSGPKAPRYTRPPKNYGVAAGAAAAAPTSAPLPQAPPARLSPQPAPKSRRQTNEHPVPARFSSRAESEKFLVESKKAGMTYRAIRKAGGFTEAESTLRGRYRGLTKTVSERLRKPEWTENDLRLLERAVRTLAQLPPAHYPDHSLVAAAQGQARYGVDLSEAKIPWKRVAEWMVGAGASYKFGNSTVCKKWEELVAGAAAEGKDPGGPFFEEEGEEDEEGEEE